MKIIILLSALLLTASCSKGPTDPLLLPPNYNLEPNIEAVKKRLKNKDSEVDQDRLDLQKALEE